LLIIICYSHLRIRRGSTTGLTGYPAQSSFAIYFGKNRPDIQQPESLRKLTSDTKMNMFLY